MTDKHHNEHAAPAITWGPVAAVAVSVVIYFLSQLIAGLLVSFYPAIKGWNSQQAADWLNNSTLVEFGLLVFIEILTLAMLRWFLKKRRASFKTLGFKPPRLKDVGYAILGLVMYVPLYIVTLSVTQHLFPRLDLDQPQQVGFDNVNHLPGLMLVFIAFVVLVPITEELVARGFLYTGLKTRLPRYAAALITSVLFASAHLQFGSGAPLLWVAAIDTFVLSLVLIYLREKTGSLWASIGLHAIKNGIAFAVLFIFK